MMSQDQKKIKCGVAGVGYLGQHHARIYNELDQCELVGVFDPDHKVLEKISAEQDCVAFKSLEDLARSCEAVSVVAPYRFTCRSINSNHARGLPCFNRKTTMR